MAAKPFISNKNESLPLFKNPVLEALTHIPPWLPFVVYTPAVGLALMGSLTKTSWGITFILAVAGVFMWTFLEYLFHRFLFHFKATSYSGKYLVFLFHGIHHDYPRDGTRLVMPLSVSLPLAFTAYHLFVVFGIYRQGLLAGLTIGYLGYDFIHFATHHFAFKNRLFQFLKAYHLKHHFSHADHSYGVSQPFWDWIFGTLPEKAVHLSESESREIAA